LEFEVGDIFFNAEGRGGKRGGSRRIRGSERELEVVGYAFDAFFEVEDVKVEEKT
jgi:hypothetical protein